MRSLLASRIDMRISWLCSGLSIGSPWVSVGMSSVRSRQGLDHRLWARLGSTGALGWAISDCTTGPSILGGVDPWLDRESIHYPGCYWSCRCSGCWNGGRRLGRSNRCYCRDSSYVQKGRYLRVKIYFSKKSVSKISRGYIPAA